MADTVKFVGSIQHTEDTIQRLFRTEYYTYEKLRFLLRLAAGAVMAAAGALGAFSLPVKGVLMLIGCWLIVSKDLPADVRADRTVDARKGCLPRNTCTFYDKRMDLDGAGHMRIKYSQFQRLVEDDEYLYLFLNRNSVCMVEKAGVQNGSAQQLMEFVEKRTGLSWTRNKSLLLMNFSDLLQAVRDRRR